MFGLLFRYGFVYVSLRWINSRIVRLSLLFVFLAISAGEVNRKAGAHFDDY